MFTIALILQSLVHCTGAAAARPELTPFSGSGAGELEEDPAPTQSTRTIAPPSSGGNRGTINYYASEYSVYMFARTRHGSCVNCARGRVALLIDASVHASMEAKKNLYGERSVC